MKVTLAGGAIGACVPDDKIDQLQWEFEGSRRCVGTRNASLHVDRDGSRHRGGSLSHQLYMMLQLFVVDGGLKNALFQLGNSEGSTWQWLGAEDIRRRPRFWPIA